MLPLMGNSMLHNRDLTLDDMNILSPATNQAYNLDKNEHTLESDFGEHVMTGELSDTLNLESLILNDSHLNMGNEEFQGNDFNGGQKLNTNFM